MPVIKVFSPPVGAPDQESHTAAAVMAKTLAMTTEPEAAREVGRKRTRGEKTRARNPNRLTLDQHVFPAKSIERFADADGRVAVHLLHRDKIVRVKPDNPLFCADRSWDQRAETGFMKQIEDAFQEAITPIVEGRAASISAEARPAVDRMYSLWYWRARYRDLESQEVDLKGIIGSDLTLEQEENLESNGYMFARKSGTMPARQLNGVTLMIRTNRFADHLADTIPRWSVIRAQAGEFIGPDMPWHGVLPLTPELALINAAPDGMITEQNLAQFNDAMRSLSEDHFFARDFARCPFSLP
jgi:hypothetical protein